MEWRGRGRRAAGAARVAVPDIERGTGEASACERIVERMLIDDLRARHIDQISRRLHETEPAGIDQVASFSRERQGDGKIIRSTEQFVELFRPADKHQSVRRVWL